MIKIDVFLQGAHCNKTWLSLSRHGNGQREAGSMTFQVEWTCQTKVRLMHHHPLLEEAESSGNSVYTVQFPVKLGGYFPQSRKAL